jgi:hypothetical protein
MSTIAARTEDESAAAVAQWEDVLRAYAEVLDSRRAVLLAVDVEDPLGEDLLIAPSFDTSMVVHHPFPDSLLPWATALLAETEGLCELARSVLASHPTPGRRRTMPEAGTGGVALDQRI